ncbi:prepilin-type N-terminal cleavage/methylation domain-containing protein [Moritella dasanensis]|uniref:prepilin-type N-terminal cleavage/methylation domain-containing protein n=1 Tax=Moritella dasanensis TaxID=428031 RepID=UPI00030B4D66|nr:prepilin-type N-terminal cleavage/methylation domain-containing protein [Moritella dasanensis]
MKRNAGFTLIELVIVIIVLGILAATAVPKFINLQDDAKKSAMKGVEAALHSAANIVYSKSAINGTETASSSSITDAGVTIDTAYGYPKAADITDAVELSGFGHTASGTSTTFWNGSSTAPATCVTYTESISSAARYTVANVTCS